MFDLQPLIIKTDKDISINENRERVLEALRAVLKVIYKNEKSTILIITSEKTCMDFNLIDTDNLLSTVVKTKVITSNHCLLDNKIYLSVQEDFPIRDDTGILTLSKFK